MSCQTCGREAEGDHQGHWLGCEEAGNARTPEESAEVEAFLEEKLAATCEFGTCANPKASKSLRAKWCEKHKDPKSREN